MFYSYFSTNADTELYNAYIMFKDLFLKAHRKLKGNIPSINNFTGVVEISTREFPFFCFQIFSNISFITFISEK